MTRRYRTLLVVSLLLATPVVAAGGSPAVAAPPSCVHAGSGTGDNYWQYGDGLWSDPSHWSQGTAPGEGSGQYVCIPDNVEVVLDAGRVDVQAFELGRGASLVLQEGSALYVWGGPEAESLTRLGSLVLVKGATLGGPGQLHIIGEVQLESTKQSEARLSGADGATGRMLVGDDATLVFAGTGDVRVTGGYTVEVRGRALTREDAGVIADPGTTVQLAQHTTGRGVGRFVIQNDRGFFSSDLTQPAGLVNEGRIVKRFATGNSAISATYSGAGEVRIRSGYLVLPADAHVPALVDAGSSVGSGTCAATRTCNTDTTAEDKQFASLTLPQQTRGRTKVVVATKSEKVRRAVGKVMKVHARKLRVSLAHPATIELRYDRSLLAAAGKPFQSAALSVAHAFGGGEYVDISDCLADGAIAAGAFACVDRRPLASRVDGSDVILVIRTIRTSRWIAF
jgi:hypothetical protein